MESVFIIAPWPYEMELKSRLERHWKLTDNGHIGWLLEDGTRVYVSRYESLGADYDPEELARVIAAIPTPVFYGVDYSDIALCRRVLLAIADDSRILVDNDHGVLLPGPDFVRLIRSRPDWDWRRDRTTSRD